MAKRRMISSALWGNPKFAGMRYRQQLLLIGMITSADDQGRLRGNPNLIRSLIFPYKNISPATIGKDLLEIAKNGTILLYQVDGQPYIQLLNWWTHQRANWAAPSASPAPPNWQDRINYRYGGKTLTLNWPNKEDSCNAQGLPPSTPIESTIESTFEGPLKAPLKAYSEVKVSEGNISSEVKVSTEEMPPSILSDYVDTFGGTINSSMAEQLRDLWEHYPALEIHEYAREEMRKNVEDRGGRPSVAYYAKCCQTKFGHDYEEVQDEEEM